MKKNLLIIGMIFGLTACGSDPVTNLYTLSSVDAVDPVSGKVTPLAVGQINLPAILDRNQLIRRTSADQIVVLPFDRWAAPLDDNIGKALTIDLEHLLPPQSVVRNNNDTSISTIDLYIDRFDADWAGHVTFDVAWSLTKGNPAKTSLRRTEHITEDADSPSASAMVEAMSRAVSDLSVKIATQLPGR